jgi:starch phosphorylase
LAELITSEIGEGWITDLKQLEKLVPLANDARFRKKWRRCKQQNKERLSQYINKTMAVRVNLESIFDCQVKRIHEYKRQLLNALHVVTLYNRIKDRPLSNFVPRTVVFGGKAAPGYWQAKTIIELIIAVADVVNNDQEIGGRLKVIFVPNYGVSLAEKIIPAADLSEQISTAGMEASGTGNMKFALNGALTIGTLDGANIEIKQEVGDDNIFIFGLTADQVTEMRSGKHNPWDYYRDNPELRRAVDMITTGFFSPSKPDAFRPIMDSLLNHGDHFMVLADYEAYVACQDRVSAAFLDREKWTRASILNCAQMGMFSSDRTIQQYAQDIWDIHPVDIQLKASKSIRPISGET